MTPMMTPVLRLALALSCSLTWTACSQTALPKALTTLQQPSTGDELRFNGPVRAWPAQTSALVELAQHVIGRVDERGELTVLGSVRPVNPRPLLELLRLTPVVGAYQEHCEGRLRLSAPQARGDRQDALSLVQVKRPGPAPAVEPELRREQGETVISLLWVDRALRVRGQQLCQGRRWDNQRWWAGFKADLQLRSGWNEVAITTRRVGGPAAFSEAFEINLAMAKAGPPLGWTAVQNTLPDPR